jgi:hypothetical protein
VKLVEKLKDKGFLTDKDAKNLVLKYPKAPRIYGLPKNP